MICFLSWYLSMITREGKSCVGARSRSKKPSYFSEAAWSVYEGDHMM